MDIIIYTNEGCMGALGLKTDGESEQNIQKFFEVFGRT